MTHVNHRKKQFPLYIPAEYEPIWDELTEEALKSGKGRGIILMECYKMKQMYLDKIMGRGKK